MVHLFCLFVCFWFWLHWVFFAVRGLLIVVASLVSEHGLQARGLQQLWFVGSRAQAQQSWCTGLVALWHVGSSRTRARTHDPCVGRRILNHCTTREAQVHLSYSDFVFMFSNRPCAFLFNLFLGVFQILFFFISFPCLDIYLWHQPKKQHLLLLFLSAISRLLYHIASIALPRQY